ETLAEFIIGPRFARTRWQAPQDEGRSLRLQADFPEPIQRDLPCPALLAKIFLFYWTRLRNIYLPIPSHSEGRVASVTNAGRGAVDAAALGVKWDGRAGFGLSRGP